MDPWFASLLSVLTFLVGLAVGMAVLAKSRSAWRTEAEKTRLSLTRAEAALQAEQDKTAWMQDTTHQLKDAFKALASDELTAKSEHLKTTSRDELDQLVAPLREHLKTLDGYVRELENKRETAYAQLGTQLGLLHDLQASLRDQTTSLAQALKAPTIQGRWGELQLRRLVELAGMANHVDFAEQEVTDTGRPDMIIRLPQGGILPIDAKVSLTAYVEAMETQDDHVRTEKLLQHGRTIRTRIRELSQKAYWSQFTHTPDVVVMFVPIEATLGAAFQHDPDLFEYAMRNRVLVSSPVLLFALLKAVAFGWQQQRIADNAAELAERGRRLHERTLGFVEHLGQIGDSLRRCVRDYNKAVGSLEGRLLPAARAFQELGGTPNVPDSPARVDVALRSPAPETGASREQDPSEDNPHGT